MNPIRILKRKNLKSLILSFCGILIFATFSCEAIIDCIINIHPALPEQQLMVGHLEEVYYEEVKASMINEPDNDNYSYNFIIEGQLPAGLFAWNNGKTFIIEGQPIQIGVFLFRLVVRATPLDPETFLCNDQTSQEYSITIQE